MIDLPPEFIVTKGGSLERVSLAERALGMPLPADYKAFLTVHDGGQGFVGDHYLVLWSADQLARFNREYEFPKYAPSLVAFGGDGGGEAFAFDTRSAPFQVVIVPLIGMDEDVAILVAPTFEGLINRMKADDSLF